MLNETDIEIEKMRMLRVIGKAIGDFARSTGINNVSVEARCCDEAVMTSDGKMHSGLNVSFTCDIYNPDWDNDDYE